MRVLAIFDFDGTLTHRDSLSDFLCFAVGKQRVFRGSVLLSPFLLAYFFRILSNNTVKQMILRHFFAGWKARQLRGLGQKYAVERLPQILRPAGMDELQWHLEQGHEVLIASASPEIWLKGWTEQLHIGLVGTLLEEIDGYMTGNFKGPNCHGKEKARRIKEACDLAKFEKIYGYGDSPDDRPMLSLSHEAFYKPFR